MKKNVLFVIVMLMLPHLVMDAQKSEPKPDTVQSLQAQLAIAKLDTAIAQYQAQSLQLQNQTDKQLAPLQKTIEDALNTAAALQGVSLKDYNYDPGTHAFVKKVEQPKSGQPSPEKPSTTPATHAPTASPAPEKKP